MSLTAGNRLGPYEIVAPLGAGGMGEVYKARDTRLGREVAVKVLPARLAEDADALGRFEREAKAVAALSHPNILALHDVGREGTVAYAVMELLEGETLRAALASGPLSSRRATDYAAQIALGLAAAHEKGIVHRDLKPDNVFVTADDRIKILDFGLAKPNAAVDTANETESPTVSGYTEPGKVMGTVGYMSPEQVRGLAVDHRSDLFSFGSVLYEMLTGRRPFQRETAAETMTAILKEEPDDKAASDGHVPPALAAVLRHCLEKKPEKRFQSARDLAFALETSTASTGVVSGSAEAVPAPSRAADLGKWLGVAALVAAAAAAGYFLRPRAEPLDLPNWSDITMTALTTDPGYEGEPTFSPDGRTIAYVSDRDGNFEIYLQQIAGGPAINLTKDPGDDVQPAFSPDGREIAFVASRGGATPVRAAPRLPHVGGGIWIMPALGGAPRRIVAKGNFPSWTPDGAEIYYVHGTFRDSHIARVPATGGESRDIRLEEPTALRYFYPRVSSDGRWLLFQNSRRIEVVEAEGGRPRVLADGQYAAWGPGSRSILFTNESPGKSQTIWTAPFSASRGELDGPSRPLTFGRGADVDAAVSADGSTIAFSAVTDTANLEEHPFDTEAGRVTGAGRELTAGNNRVGFYDPSPNGASVAFAAERGGLAHLWRVDAPAPPLELTRDPGYAENFPVWSPDGREIAFIRARPGQTDATSLWVMKTDGTSPRQVSDGPGFAAWLPDGKSVLAMRDGGIVRIDLSTGSAVPVEGAATRTWFAVDQSGRWIAFQTAQEGAVTVAVVPATGGEPRIVVPPEFGAFHPFFSPSGNWLYFQPNHKNIFRVPGPAQNWKSAPPQQVTEFSGVDLYLEDPRISRDGKKLFFTRGRRTGDILILHLGRGEKR
jgi:Tol biopolymer transport system component